MNAHRPSFEAVERWRWRAYLAAVALVAVGAGAWAHAAGRAKGAHEVREAAASPWPDAGAGSVYVNSGPLYSLNPPRWQAVTFMRGGTAAAYLRRSDAGVAFCEAGDGGALNAPECLQAIVDALHGARGTP